MRITGTHVYGMLRCPHMVVLDLTEDRAKRRPVTEIEEFVRRRGRDWEEEFVATLEGFVEPRYDRGAWEDAAAQTAAFLRDGVPGVSQGVLVGENRLGIPDLLRREPGASALGDFHYVVGDVKSSGRPRSDQLLQVAFYSRMLAELQDRAPEYGYLVLKDGREERFVLAEFSAALDQVEERVFALAADPTASQPFFSAACSKCHWSELCVPRMQAASDLSLVAGMTRGLRTTLMGIGVDDVAKLANLAVEPTARRTHLEPALLRRLKKAADAHLAGSPSRQKRARQLEPSNVAVVYHLYDAFAERMLFFGLQFPATPDGEFAGVCPTDRDTECRDFLRLVSRLPAGVRLLHYGDALPRWFTESRAPEERRGIESRFVDLARRLRGAAIYQSPVFGLADHVEYALGLDPHRAGDADGAAIRIGAPDGVEWMMHKGRSDLADLCRLVAFLHADGKVRRTAPQHAPALQLEEGAT